MVLSHLSLPVGFFFQHRITCLFLVIHTICSGNRSCVFMGNVHRRLMSHYCPSTGCQSRLYFVTMVIWNRKTMHIYLKKKKKDISPVTIYPFPSWMTFRFLPLQIGNTQPRMAVCDFIIALLWFNMMLIRSSGERSKGWEEKWLLESISGSVLPHVAPHHKHATGLWTSLLTSGHTYAKGKNSIWKVIIKTLWKNISFSPQRQRQLQKKNVWDPSQI